MTWIPFTERLAKLTDLLADDAYHSGEDLAIQMGTSRANIWKSIQKLRELGLPIHAAPNKGYRLSSTFSCLKPDAIEEELASKGINIPIHYQSSMDSSNEEAFRQLRANQREPMIILTEQQSQGRGRMGKTWSSPVLQNLYLSILTFLPPNFGHLGTLGLHVSLGVAQSLQAYLPHPVQIKWPNDLICQDQKIAGILIESIAEAQRTVPFIIGIGVNVNATEGSTPYASLAQLSGTSINRHDLLVNLIASIQRCLDSHRESGFQKAYPKWQALDYLRDQHITCMQGQETIEGIARSITPSGELIIEQSNGQRWHVSHGEVHHVRGVRQSIATPRNPSVDENAETNLA